MKVTHVLYLSEVPGHSPLSGAENHLWVLLPGLVKKGIDVEIVTVLWRGADSVLLKQKLEELVKKEVKVTVIKNKWQETTISEKVSKILTWQKLWRCLQERRDNIIHLHLEPKYTPFIAWASGCRKVIYSVHNDLPMFRKITWRIRLRALNYIVSHYIAITGHVRSYYMEVSGASPDQITTVYYGIEAPSTQSCTRHEFGIPVDAYVVGYVGRLTEQKNLGVFLEALRHRPNVLGVIVGNGPQRGKLMRYVETQQIGNVRFLGAIPAADRVMPLFNLFCLPSLWEGLGLVLIEAMLRRVPIIGSRQGAIPEILGQGRYGILFDPTVDGLIQAIDFALKSPSFLSTQADEAYEYARKQFTVESMVQKTIRVYQSIEKREKFKGQGLISGLLSINRPCQK